MGVLRERMAREFSASTQKLYLAALTDLAGYHRQSPDTLDTTTRQSIRDHPAVLLRELAKVREDPTWAGNPIGGLVRRNRSGIGSVVFSEIDCARI